MQFSTGPLTGPFDGSFRQVVRFLNRADLRRHRAAIAATHCSRYSCLPGNGLEICTYVGRCPTLTSESRSLHEAKRLRDNGQSSDMYTLLTALLTSGVHGQCLRAVFTGGVHGRCSGAVLKGGVQGRCSWAVFMGSAYGRRLRAVFTGGVHGRRSGAVLRGGAYGRRLRAALRGGASFLPFFTMKPPRASTPEIDSMVGGTDA